MYIPKLKPIYHRIRHPHLPESGFSEAQALNLDLGLAVERLRDLGWSGGAAEMCLNCHMCQVHVLGLGIN